MREDAHRGSPSTGRHDQAVGQYSRTQARSPWQSSGARWPQRPWLNLGSGWAGVVEPPRALGSATTRAARRQPAVTRGGSPPLKGFLRTHWASWVGGGAHSWAARDRGVRDRARLHRCRASDSAPKVACMCHVPTVRCVDFLTPNTRPRS